MEGGSSKVYRCSYCPFSTPLLVYLYAHERTHTGLGNSLPSSSGQGGGGGGGGSGSTNSSGAVPGLGMNPEGGFQCPMCFHTFQQVETFQQHLIGHQMSGVLAPFFNPASSPAGGLHSALATPDSQNDGPEGHLPFSALSIPLLNGMVGGPGAENFYWALKNSQNGTDADHPSTEDNQSNEPASPLHQEQRSIKKEMAPSSKMEQLCEQGSNEDKKSRNSGHHTSVSSLVTVRKRARERVLEAAEEEDENDENENDATLLMSKECGRKRGKINSFRCFYCQMAFKSRPECASHIQQKHSEEQKRRKRIKAKERKTFRCRKCKFSTNQYQTLVVHNRVHHSLIRGYHFAKEEKKGGRFGLLNWNKDAEELLRAGDQSGPWNIQGLPLGRAIPQEGVSGDYLMQGFLLFCSADEESSRITGDGGDNCNNYKIMDAGKDTMRESGQGITAKEGCHLQNKDDSLQGCKELITSHHNNNYNCSPKIQSGLFVPSLVYLPVREKVKDDRFLKPEMMMT